MIKFTDTMVTFREVPNEISLCINISNCPNHCLGCHSKELQEDIGEHLTCEKLCSLIEENKGITCVCFMGGDANFLEIQDLCCMVKLEFPTLLTCWYSGRNKLPKNIDLGWFNFIKLGPYKEECGGLDNPNTNQRFYKVQMSRTIIGDFPIYSLMDITNKFWKIC